MGGVLMHDKVAEPFFDGRADYNNGYTFGGHPTGSVVALKTIEILERENVLGNVELEPCCGRGSPQFAFGHPDRRAGPRHRPLLGDRGGP